jgi:hypothetical protein
MKTGVSTGIKTQWKSTWAITGVLGNCHLNCDLKDWQGQYREESGKEQPEGISSRLCASAIAITCGSLLRTSRVFTFNSVTHFS